MDTPETFTVLYNGQPVEFSRVDYGWAFQCPGCVVSGKCRSYHWIATEQHPLAVEPRRLHKITSAPGEPVTIEGSLGCNCTGGGGKCTWHVLVNNGVAKDA